MAVAPSQYQWQMKVYRNPPTKKVNNSSGHSSTGMGATPKIHSPKANSSPLKIDHPQRKFIFHPSIFRCFHSLASFQGGYRFFPCRFGALMSRSSGFSTLDTSFGARETSVASGAHGVHPLIFTRCLF